CIIAGGADDMLAGDVALICGDLPLAAGCPLEALDLGFKIDPGAAVARTLGHGLCHVRRRDMAVIGIVEGRQHLLALDEWPELQRFRGTQELGPVSLRMGDAHIAPEFIEPLAAVRQAQLAAFMPTYALTGIGLESLIDLDGLGNHAADIEV